MGTINDTIMANICGNGYDATERANNIKNAVIKEREILIGMIEELIDSIESANKVEELFTDRFYEICSYVYAR